MKDEQFSLIMMIILIILVNVANNPWVTVIGLISAGLYAVVFFYHYLRKFF